MPNRPGDPRPLDLLWQPRTLLWIVLAGEALAALLALAPGVQGARLTYFGMASFAIQWVFVMSLSLLYLARSWLQRASPPLIAQSGLASLLLSTWLVAGMARLFLPQLGLVPASGWNVFTLQMTLMALTVGMLAFAAFQAQWRARQLAVRAKQAELDALQARIRPHFLFNALNTGIALVHGRPEATERLLLDLSDLFRAAISGRERVSLAEELSLTRRYLEIERLRFGDRLQVRWDVPEDDPGLGDIDIPPLSIQPLVENAIKHGIEPARAGGVVTIALHRSPDLVTIEVRNPVAIEGVLSTGHGIGLNAVRSRLQVFTHGEGGVATAIEDGEHVATLRLPLR
ncbi:sensor histidine kinase [Luteimonas kalidii]|uniref:Histidine kinase n=1 Tax=Luteimonas kalidii TaxID=3042025 RepID=A0ABT6JY87_9GAMM|nr:histidine kinase [Luteimonas kalidii]MDH5835544.1 histidine kinase [Luteimonas kalidii]